MLPHIGFIINLGNESVFVLSALLVGVYVTNSKGCPIIRYFLKYRAYFLI